MSNFPTILSKELLTLIANDFGTFEDMMTKYASNPTLGCSGFDGFQRSECYGFRTADCDGNGCVQCYLGDRGSALDRNNKLKEHVISEFKKQAKPYSLEHKLDGLGL